jgi:hypothetical protein
VQALKGRYKDPKQEVCRWNELVQNQPSIFESIPGFRPTPANPVVFHLFGYMRNGPDTLPESLVLTEDDYLDFLVNVSRDQNLLPPRIRESLAGTSLLFLGYRITDWDFRILLRIVSSYLGRSLHRRAHVSVQLMPEEDRLSDSQRAKTQDYLSRYFGKLDIGVHWGTCQEFVIELRRQWEDLYGAH